MIPFFGYRPRFLPIICLLSISLVESFLACYRTTCDETQDASAAAVAPVQGRRPLQQQTGVLGYYLDLLQAALCTTRYYLHDRALFIEVGGMVK